MFWKTMAATWTALLLILVAMLWTVRAGGPVAETGGRPRGSARPAGTQAIALLDLPSPYPAVANAAIYAPAVRSKLLGSKAVAGMPEAFRKKLAANMARYVTAGALLPGGTSHVAVYIRGCKDRKAALALARAAAESLASYVCQRQKLHTDVRLGALKSLHDDIKKRAQRISRESALARGASPGTQIRARQKTIAARVERLQQNLIEAEDEQLSAQAKWAVWQEDVKKGKLHESFEVQAKLEADPMLYALTCRLIELKTHVPSGSAPASAPALKKAVTWVEQQMAARRKKLIQAAAAERQLAVAVATHELASARKRLNQAKAEGRDLDVTLGRIEALKDEADLQRQDLRELDRQILELQLQPGPDPQSMIMDVFAAR